MAYDDTKEQRKARISALLKERSDVTVYVAGAETDEAKEEQEDRLSAIDAELAYVGHEAKAPAKRAETRPASEGRATR